MHCEYFISEVIKLWCRGLRLQRRVVYWSVWTWRVTQAGLRLLSYLSALTLYISCHSEICTTIKNLSLDFWCVISNCVNISHRARLSFPSLGGRHGCRRGRGAINCPKGTSWFTPADRPSLRICFFVTFLAICVQLLRDGERGEREAERREEKGKERG